MNRTARIFEDTAGKYHVCDDAAGLLDVTDAGHITKHDALVAAANSGYTHAIGSGTYWGNQVRGLSPWRRTQQGENQ